MPNVAFLVPVRNKEKRLTRLVESVFAQDYAGMEILLSDQGSTDGSRGLLANLARSYNGPNKVRTLDCPDLEFNGLAGLNAHFDWLHTQTDAEIIFFACADDWVHPQRVTKVLREFEAHDPSMVMNSMFFTDDQMNYQGISVGSNNGNRWIKPEEIYTTMIGSSTAHTWTHEFYDKVGGLAGVGGEDMVFPMLAALDKGCWFLDEQLYTYIRYADKDNAGLEGVLRAATSEAEKMQIEELMHVESLAALYSVIGKMNAANLSTDEAVGAIATHIIDRAASLQSTRIQMATRRIPPQNLRI